MEQIVCETCNNLYVADNISAYIDGVEHYYTKCPKCGYLQEKSEELIRNEGLYNKIIYGVDVVNAIRGLCSANDGDEATIDLLLSIGAELLGVSVDTFMEL